MYLNKHANTGSKRNIHLRTEQLTQFQCKTSQDFFFIHAQLCCMASFASYFPCLSNSTSTLFKPLRPRLHTHVVLVLFSM